MATPAVIEIVFEGNTKGIEGATDKVKGKLGSLGGVAKGAGMAIAGGLALGGAAAVAGAAAAGKAWFDFASETDQAINELRGSLGLTEDEARELGEVGKEVFANNWGESIGEATAVVGELRKAFFGLSNDELAGVTEQAFAIRDAFGTEVEGTIAAAQRIAGAFGISAGEAMDTLATGMQFVGEEGSEVALLMQEYSGHLAEMGFSAEDAFAAMQSGMEAGAFEGDKVLDMFKEMNLKLTEGSDATREALGRLGISGLIEDFRSGEVTGAQAFQTIQGALENFEGAIPADLLADTLGSPAEDMGAEVVKNVYLAADSFQVMEGAAMDAGNAVNDNIGSAFETMKRTALTALGELGGGAFEPLKRGIIDAMGTVTEKIALFGELMGTAGDWSSSFGETIATVASEVTGLDLSILEPMINGLITVGTAAIDMIGEFMGWLESLRGDFETTQASTEELRAMFEDAFRVIWDVVQTVWAWLDKNIVPIITTIVGTVVDKISELRDEFNEKFGGIREVVASVIGWMQEYIGPALAHIWGIVGPILQGVVDTFANALPALQFIVSGVFDVIVGIIQAAFTIIKGIFEIALKLITGDWRGAWDSLKGTIADVIPAIKKILNGLLDFILGLGGLLITAVMEIGAGIVEGLWNGIQNAWGNFIGGFRKKVEEIPRAAAEAVGFASPAKEFIRIGEGITEGLAMGLGGLDKIREYVNETLGKMIDQTDVESFEQVARAVAAIRDITVGTVEAIDAIMSADLSNAPEVIEGQFRALVDGFRGVLDAAKELSLIADKKNPDYDQLRKDGVDLKGLLNFWDVQNIESVMGVFGDVTSAIEGLVGIYDAIAASASDFDPAAIEQLRDGLHELGALAKSIGDEFGGDEGVTAAGNIAGSLKAMADVLSSVASLDLAGIVALTADQMETVKANAIAMVNAIFEVSAAFKTAAEDDANGLAALQTGVEAYATVVGAARDMLDAAAIDELAGAVRISDRYMSVIKSNAEKLVTTIRDAASDFIAMAGDESGGLPALLEGVEAFASVVSDMVGVINDMADAELTKTMNVVLFHFGMSLQILDSLRAVMQAHVTAWAEGIEDFDAVQDAWDHFATITGSIVDVANTIESAAMTKLLDVTVSDFEMSLFMLDNMRRHLSAFVDDWAAGIEDYEAVQAKWDHFGTITSAMVAVANAIQGAHMAKTLDVTVRDFEMSLHMLDNMRRMMADHVDEWTRGLDEAAMTELAGKWSFFANIVGTIAGVVSSVMGAGGEGGGFKPGAVETAVDHIKLMFRSLSSLVTGDDALDPEQAATLAALATAAGSMAEGLSGVLGTIMETFENPFSRIKATGQRGETFRTNLKNKLKESLKKSVQTITEALAEMAGPDGVLANLTVPEESLTALDRLTDSFAKVADLMATLDGISIDKRKVMELGAVIGIMAASVPAQGISVGGNAADFTDLSGEAPAGMEMNVNISVPTIRNELSVEHTTNIQVGPAALAPFVDAWEEISEQRGRLEE